MPYLSFLANHMAFRMVFRKFQYQRNEIVVVQILYGMENSYTFGSEGGAFIENKHNIRTIFN